MPKPQLTPWQAVIDWHAEAVLFDHVANTDHPYLQRHGWFMVLGAVFDAQTYVAADDGLDLLYVGDAFRQTLGEKLTSDLPTFERIRAALTANKTCVVVLGCPTARSRKQRGVDYLEGVLWGLRNRHRTIVKDRGAGGVYRGKTLKITNEGAHSPLKRWLLVREVDSLPVEITAPEKRASDRFKIAPAGSSSTVRRRKRRPPTTVATRA